MRLVSQCWGNGNSPSALIASSAHRHRRSVRLSVRSSSHSAPSPASGIFFALSITPLHALSRPTCDSPSVPVVAVPAHSLAYRREAMLALCWVRHHRAQSCTYFRPLDIGVCISGSTVSPLARLDPCRQVFSSSIDTPTGDSLFYLCLVDSP